ncbi:MAG: DNA gyrase subunit A [Candidatus Margulisiibacteriota bacterium]
MEKQETLFQANPLDGTNVVPLNIVDEMKSSYIDYAMSVIVSRALPDARDGLKPVHRRILFAMNEQGMTPGRPYKKSARLVGDVLGKYHPHGDSAVYDAMVRMAQDFAMRYPLVDGQGNFGSIDGDNAAAMRYTEARMARIATPMLEDIDKETVDFIPNFDESLQEPTVLPAKLPNLLLNGASGIAVGMATNIPPHNLGELIDGIIELIDNPDATIADLMQHIKGPDFPTGGSICGKEGIQSAYYTGRGSVVMRAKIHTEEVKRKKDREALIVTEIPYQVNKSNLVIRIADLVRDKKLTGIADLRDESDRKGMRIYIEMKKDANPDVVLNQLYKHTPLRSTFGVNLLAIVDGVPRTLNLKECLQQYLKHRENIITRRTQYDLRKAEERAHILEGLRIALQNLDAVIKQIRASKTAEEAKTGLVAQFGLTEIQAQAILDMRLQRLTGLEQEKIESEYHELLKIIADLKDILANRIRVLDIIKEELADIKAKFNNERRTQLEASAEEVDLDDLIPEETVAVFVTTQGFIKRVAVDSFRSQLRGGRGVMGMNTRDEDKVDTIMVVSTHTWLLCFTNFGKAYRLKVYSIPDATKQGKGRSFATVLNLADGEWVRGMVPIDDFTSDNTYLMMATEKGVVKKTALSEFQHLRNSSVIAIKLDQDDDLLMVHKTNGNQDVVMATRNGVMIRFQESDVRVMGRATRGVRGISLKGEDQVISFDIVRDNVSLFLATHFGYGKRTQLTEYRCQNRGGMGVRAIQLRDKKGEKDTVIKSLLVGPGDELICVTKNGTVNRQEAYAISSQRRAARGVIVQRLDDDDELIDVARVVKEDADTEK